MLSKGNRSLYGVVLLAAVAAVVQGVEPILSDDVPERVAEYTSRVYQCIDWARELHSGVGDPARAAIVTRAIEALDCKNLALEASYLQQHYTTYSPAAEAVDVATRDWQNSLRSDERNR